MRLPAAQIGCRNLVLVYHHRSNGFFKAGFPSSPGCTCQSDEQLAHWGQQRTFCQARRQGEHSDARRSTSASVQSAGTAGAISIPLPQLQIARLQKVWDLLASNERLLIVAASTFLCSLSHTALRPVLPVFAKGFGVGAAAVGTTISAYALARLMMNLPAGMLADSHGRKPLLVWGPAITALGMIGCGTAATFQHLLAWRWVTGIGSALQMAGAHLFLADISQPSNRARSLGVNQIIGGQHAVQAASLVGSLLGPTIGGFLAEMAGLRAPFTVTGLAALLAAAYGLWRLPETRRASGAPQPVFDLKALAHQWSPKQLLAFRLAGRPKWLQLVLSRNFGAIALVNACMFMTQNGARAVLMPLLAIQGCGLSPKTLGLLFSGMAVVSLLLVMPASFAADKLGRKWTIVPSCIGLAAALGLMAAAGNAAFFVAAAGLYAMSNACVGATPVAYASDVMPSGLGGFGLGIYRCAGDLGLMLGPAFLGWVADMSSVQTALCVNAIMLLAVVAYFGMRAEEAHQ